MKVLRTPALVVVSAFLLATSVMLPTTSACGFSKAATFVVPPKRTITDQTGGTAQLPSTTASLHHAGYVEFHEEESSKLETYGKSSLVVGLVSTIVFFVKQGVQSIANISDDDDDYLTEKERELRVIDLETLVLCASVVTGLAAVVGNALKWF